jgi:hypothetical protein
LEFSEIHFEGKNAGIDSLEFMEPEWRVLDGDVF